MEKKEKTERGRTKRRKTRKMEEGQKRKDRLWLFMTDVKNVV